MQVANLTINRIEQELGDSFYIKKEGIDYTLYPRGKGDIDKEVLIYEHKAYVDINYENEFRVFKKDWPVLTMGSVLLESWNHISEDLMLKQFELNTQLGIILEVEGGPYSFENYEEVVIFFSFLAVLSKLSNSLLFIDPHGNLNNSEYFKKIGRKTYTLELFLQEVKKVFGYDFSRLLD